MRAFSIDCEREKKGFIKQERKRMHEQSKEALVSHLTKRAAALEKEIRSLEKLRNALKDDEGEIELQLHLQEGVKPCVPPQGLN